MSLAVAIRLVSLQWMLTFKDQEGKFSLADKICYLQVALATLKRDTVVHCSVYTDRHSSSQALFYCILTTFYTILRRYL